MIKLGYNGWSREEKYHFQLAWLCEHILRYQILPKKYRHSIDFGFKQIKNLRRQYARQSKQKRSNIL